MAIQQIQLPGYRPRKPSTMEQIALGVDMASKILGTGLKAYEVFGPKGQADTDEAKARAKLYEAQANDTSGDKQLDRDLKRSQIEANIAAANATTNVKKRALELPNLSPGQEALDKEYAKSYNEFVTQGGYATADKNIQELERVRSLLPQLKNATGPGIGLLPKALRDVITPEGASLQDAVENVVQRNLRQTLGAQFTENEGKQLLQRAYNPRLPASENIRRIDSLLNQIKQTNEAQQDAARFFQLNHTLNGFKGKPAARSINDILPEPKLQPDELSPHGHTSTAPPAGKIHVSNPKTGEQFYIDPQHLNDAQKEGFQQIK